MIVTAALWFCAIGCGLLAGVYFTFSAFVMRALGAISPAAGIAAMNAINARILRSAFMPLFLGTTLGGIGLAAWALPCWRAPGMPCAFIGGTIHGVGMFVVTIARNVPLNDRLMACDPTTAAGEATWRDYIDRWTRWNHLRTLSCILAAVAFSLALIDRA